MKKLFYLLMLFLAVQVTVFSQTAIIDEDFMNPVSDWEMEGNWTQEDGYLMLYYYPIVEDYDFSTFTPEFQVPDNGGDIVISLFLDVYLSNASDEQCEISVVSGDQEDVIWTHNLTDGPWGDFSGTDLSLSVDDYIGETVKLRLRSYGASTSALWGWFIFNVNLTTWFDHELCAMEIAGPTNLDMMETGTWEVDVKNQGLNSESDFAVNLFSEKSSEILATGYFNGELNSGDVGVVTIDWASDIAHNTVLYASIDSQTDQFVNNNNSSGRFLRVEPDVDYNILFWDNDNGIASVENPETGMLQEPHQGLQKAFQACGISIDYVTSLPDDLQGYDLVVTTMGNYCLS